MGAASASTVNFVVQIMLRCLLDFVSHSAVDQQVFFSMCSPARDLSAGYHAVSFLDEHHKRALTDISRRLPVGPFYGR